MLRVVMWQHVVLLYWVVLEERLSVRVLASAVDESSTALARTRTLRTIRQQH